MEEINNFQQELDESLFRAWERFKELLMKCPQYYFTNTHEVNLFYNGLDVPTRQILDSKGVFPTKTTTDAKVAIQEMKANKKVYAAKVRCELCKGPHYTKDCPLKEKGKTLEEAYYTQFGAPYQPGGQYRAAGPGFYQRNNGNSSYPDQRQTLEESLTKFMTESAKRHEENSSINKEILASTDAAIKNQGASIKTLEIQIGQMSKVLQERGIRRPYAVSDTQYSSLSSKTVSFTNRLHGYYCEDWKEERKVKILETYDHILPQKEKDAGSFTLPCFIYNICFDKALVDLGASVSVMPFSTSSNLGPGDLDHTRITIELVDRTIKHPRVIAENLLVRIGKFIFTIDFVILDIPEDDDISLILRRPFPSTTRGPEFTWEREDQFKKKYPHLFSKTAPSSNSVMSDLDESGVTHTEVSSLFKDLSDIRSLRADDHEAGPLAQDMFQGQEHAEDEIVADDEIVAEDQPYAEDASPTAQSPDYVPDTDPEADPEEDDDEDPEEDPIDYPADGGDDGDDEMDIDEDDDMDIDADEEDEDDEMDVEVDEEAEEEHPAPAYPVVVALPATAPSAEETEPFETDESAATPPPHPAYRMTARITIPEPLPVPAWSDSEVARLLAISSPPASPLSPWSSSPPQIPFPLSPPLPVLTAPPPSPIRSLGYRAATIRMRAEAAATSHSLPLPPPFILSPTRPDAPPPMPTSAPTSLPPLLLPSASRGEDRPEVNLPPRERLGIALGPRYEVGESSAAAAARPAGGLRADYGFDEIVETLQGAPVSTDTELGAHVRDFESMVRRDTDEIYTMLDDEQSQRQLLASRVNMLFRDRRAHAHTRLLMETEARMSREAWGRSMDASDLARAEVMSLRTTVHAQMSEITELQSADRSRRRAISDLLETDRGRREEMRELRAADRTRQQQIIQTLTVMQTLQREMIPLQGLVTTLQGQVTALQGQVMALQGQVTALQGQQGPAGGPAQPELPEEAGSSS
ncbi:DNA/RNA polymerases superfamily protein [Tanacetum coccineum]